MAEIGDKIEKRLTWTGPEPAPMTAVVGMFEQLALSLGGEGSRVLGVEADLLKPVHEGQELALEMRLVDKGRGTKILFGRGVGQILGVGAFAVVVLRILLPPRSKDKDVIIEEVTDSP